MTANAMSPCVARPSAVMVLLCGVDAPLPSASNDFNYSPYECHEMIGKADIY